MLSARSADTSVLTTSNPFSSSMCSWKHMTVLTSGVLQSSHLPQDGGVSQAGMHQTCRLRHSVASSCVIHTLMCAMKVIKHAVIHTMCTMKVIKHTTCVAHGALQVPVHAPLTHIRTNLVLGDTIYRYQVLGW